MRYQEIENLKIEYSVRTEPISTLDKKKIIKICQASLARLYLE